MNFIKRNLVFGQNILFGPTLVSRTDSGYTQVHPSGQVIRKGVRPDVDSYSAFFDNSKLSKTALEEIIKKELVSDIYVCGIATDVCVGKKSVCLSVKYSPCCKNIFSNKMHEILLEDMLS